ncbi:nuclear transport factor 2 family protein [Pseudomonas sp. MH9.2]|uniref:nuclear transport factor 2 family protein n=1 Tax=unclassified Pseudomonas TaxID=196821 RepID=UPI002AC8FA55|nr:MULTISPECIES: nuclear transport factor 2 family protein [unclassified Pseudomonas]MEB0008955.1 nuclear transport factor 2 family protein [Pseudomonas sp. RTB2]MEB0015418.1 nuclear transport factor 2 family protein [Pseudomonas sp. RTB3]MEB0024369.1 nuclear transport factor 2 family protein [Pseudomonas sp. MH9.2]MEB0149607.1 nuclear transport factor 2 family protein [Pseudomonas sp. CCC2.2]MEB0272129.1 nuclear transport factor 2 family protein [Pseudomonas sp. 5B4]
MSDANNAVITEFYQAFNRLDAEAMSACYTEDVLFSDPVFGELRGRQAGDMWRMLTSRAKDFSVVFDNLRADERTGGAHWVATYLFSQTGNTVVNDIQARFVFRDGKICEHHDHFDLWRWSRQALGTKGLLLGWTPFVQNAIRAQAQKGLKAFQAGR